ncbi:MAG: hypothetical protein QM519_03410, partial [Bacteroidia bacterium]|nr:hypothetical protein [Bacteroidia bacterium]
MARGPVSLGRHVGRAGAGGVVPAGPAGPVPVEPGPEAGGVPPVVPGAAGGVRGATLLAPVRTTPEVRLEG